MGGVSGLAGWQWLFLLEAIPSFVLGVVVILVLDKGIEQAKWLTDDEKRTLAANIAADASGTTSHSFKDGFTRPMVWALCVIYLFFIMGLYGVSFWLPTLIKGSGVKDPLTIGLLTMLPYAAAAISMIVVGRSSDARRERRWHIALPGLIGTAGWVATVVIGNGNVTLSMIGLTIATMGVMTTLCQFWCLPTAILAGAAAATGVAVVNSVGNLAGFVSPYVIGWIIDKTHSTDLGVYTLAACLSIGGLLVLALPKHLVNR
jgi:sugar phosphate permease